MSEPIQKADLPWIIQTYFSNPEKYISVSRGEILLDQNSYNDRLFLVKKGTFAAYYTKPDGQRLKLFTATQNMFLGVISYFSRTFSSSATVIAEENSEIAYIDQFEDVHPEKCGCCLFEQFMPVMVTELAQRNQREQQNAIDKENALKKLIHSEKMASLGQMAAGIAHELNNAISVLERNTDWLCERLNQAWQNRAPNEYEYFKLGLNQGRNLPTREVRQRVKTLQKNFNLTDENARIIAETGIDLDHFSKSKAELNSLAGKFHYYWEIGAVFHDMKIAANHATHVVRSVKDLATPTQPSKSLMNINDSIHEAVTLLRSPLRKVTMHQFLSPLPQIMGNRVALVQVWTNLIKNGIESMGAAQIEQPELKVISSAVQNYIKIDIQDNGPGIPKNDIDKIFQPNFTTKEKGLDFGLGLGLTIVARIIENHNGEISVKSKPGKTSFTIKLPIR